MTAKQRKLKYIREKNGLRTGKKSIDTFVKLNNQIIQYSDINVYIDSFVMEAKNYAIKKWKVNLENIKLNYGLDGDDFIRDLTTIKITLSL